MGLLKLLGLKKSDEIVKNSDYFEKYVDSLNMEEFEYLKDAVSLRKLSENIEKTRRGIHISNSLKYQRLRRY